jgi:hypothetical protein
MLLPRFAKHRGWNRANLDKALSHKASVLDPLCYNQRSGDEQSAH